MQFREITQHHVPAIFSVFTLFVIDSVSYYSTFLMTKYLLNNFVSQFATWVAFLLVILTLYLLKRYDPSPRVSIVNEIKIISQSIYFLGITYLIVIIFFKGISIEDIQYHLLFLHLFLIIVISMRFIVRNLQRLFLKMGYGGRSTILLGKGDEAIHVAKSILNRPTLGFFLKGYFSQNESIEMNKYCTYLGHPDKIKSFLKINKIYEMIVILNNHEHDKLLEIIGQYAMLDICIKIIPDMYESISGQARINVLNDIPLMDINPDIMTEFQSLLKRTIDIVLSIISIIIFCPLSIIFMILILINSPGGIFYKQIRLGKNGIKYQVYKFRSMYKNSENKTGPIWSDQGDRRITPIGKVMRKYHLDEIPQFYNVIKGQMSLVGPRPERPAIIESLSKEIPYYTHRLKVKPGITGWAQVRGFYDNNLADVFTKLKNDFFYIENLSLILDIKILLMTILVMLKGEGR